MSVVLRCAISQVLLHIESPHMYFHAALLARETKFSVSKLPGLSYLPDLFNQEACDPYTQNYFDYIHFSIDIYKMSKRNKNKEDNIKCNIISVGNNWRIEEVTELVQAVIFLIYFNKVLRIDVENGVGIKPYISFKRLTTRKQYS